MSTYVIGDVQGCYQELQELLAYIAFDPTQDRLGFVGDLVNRGPNSLDVLRFIRSLDDPLVVLGNHDLYLLIIGYDLMPIDSYPHSLHGILEAPDKKELLDWLRHQPLIRYEKNLNSLLVHAGIPPQWSIAEGLRYGEEVSHALRGKHFKSFLNELFGNSPEEWDTKLHGQNRLRYITNALTRMRFCDGFGKLDLHADGNLSSNRHQFQPWFQWRDASKDHTHIIFGHWAALNGHCDATHCHALDTGCAWGYSLTALRLEDQKRFSVACHSSLRM